MIASNMVRRGSKDRTDRKEKRRHEEINSRKRKGEEVSPKADPGIV